MKRLNLGSGYVNKEGWVHVDIKDYGSNVMADVRDRLPFDDETFDFVLMNHTLQMFTYEELPVVLKEVRRVMKPGAILRILTPDLDKAMEQYKLGNWEYFRISPDIEESISGMFARYLFWHGDTRCAFTDISLVNLLVRNGFNVEGYKPRFGECELDSREEESLVMTCQK